MDRGANPLHSTKGRDTPLHLALSDENDPAAATAVAHLLLHTCAGRANFDPDAKNAAGDTAMALAVKAVLPDVVERLAKAGADMSGVRLAALRTEFEARALLEATDDDGELTAFL